MRFFVLAFVLGAWSLQRQASLPDVALLGLGAVAVLTIPLARRAPDGLRVGVVVLAGFAAGFAWAAWRAHGAMEDALPRRLEGRDIVVRGVVAGLPRVGENATRFVFHVEWGPAPRTVSLAWFPEPGLEPGELLPPPALVPGERWTMSVRLKRPRGSANPHGFDYEAWALERGIRAVGYVRSREGYTRDPGRVEGWPYTVHRWRGEVRSRMAAQLGDGRMAGVLVALAIGDQDAISPEDWDVFWRTGVGHLMSISGLHITMLAALAFAIVFRAWVRVPGLALVLPARKAAAVAGAAVALAYALVSGYAVPAQRTVVMVGVVAACVLANRHGSASRVLALAALAVVVVDPWAVRSAGFWLSFGAVAAIFYAMGARTGSRGAVASAAIEQWAVTVAMVPMLLALFHQFSWVSPLANALAIPVVSLVVVPLTLLGAFVSWAVPLDAAHTLMAWLMQPLESLASWPAAMLESHAPSVWTLAAAGLGCAWLLAPRGVPLRPLGAVWMLSLATVGPARPLPGEAWIDVLDVGHGLAVALRTANHALVYDAGPKWTAESDSGARVVVPFLRGEGVRRIDGLVVSHADDDHAGGAASVARLREPHWLLSPLAADDALHASVANSVRCQAGRAWRWDGVQFTVLHPAAQAFQETRKRKENDRSCVLRVATRGASMLLTGDVESRAEAEMLARGPGALRADVLLVPHHGSRSSSTAAFLDAVSPTAALIPAGHRNRFGHPHESVVARLAQRGIAVRRTDEEGALRVALPRTAGSPVRVHGRQLPCRYWSERPCARSPP